MNRHQHRFTPYTDLSSRRQRDAFVRLRWRILRHTPVFGGLFTSVLALDPTRPAIHRQWFHARFLGLDGRTIWNASLVTGRSACWARAGELAFEQTRSKLTEAELQAELRREFIPGHWIGGKRFCYLQRSAPRRPASLGGMTVREHEARVSATILRDDPPEIRESFRLDHRHAQGIGLHIVLDVPAIDRAAIERAIHRFRALGEADWQSPTPIPRAHLPCESMGDAFRRARERQRAEHQGEPGTEEGKHARRGQPATARPAGFRPCRHAGSRPRSSRPCCGGSTARRRGKACAPPSQRRRCGKSPRPRRMTWWPCSRPTGTGPATPG